MAADTEQRRQAALAWLEGAVHDGSLTADTAHNCRRWLERPAYREWWPPIVELIERRDVAELARLFWERIPFGTGGRRGPMAAFGSATINRRTIAESAYGLGVYVRQATGRDRPRAAVAYDSRNNSWEFARVTATVLAALGFEVWLYRAPRSTPQLSFTVRRLGCQCGVMISASHNPPADNGFKAYWSHGGQVLPPHDRGILECVEAADEIAALDFEEAAARGSIRWVGDELDREFAQAVCAQSLSAAREIRAVYTPLHGVGESSVWRVIQEAGFRGCEIFEPQRAPDGGFPNVPGHLPNPERSAVFQPAIAACQGRDIDLILASDPDADRLAVCARAPDGVLVCLSGNQLGALLADYALRRRQQAGTLSAAHYVVSTLVTTPLIAEIAQEYGVDCVRDLPVGFKHIAAVIEARGAATFVLGLEESIGYLAGDYARDKDAAIAALWVLELAAELKQRQETLLDRLEELFRLYGRHRESQVSQEFPGPTGADQIAGLVARLRAAPPLHFEHLRFHRLRDYGRREVRSLPGGERVGELSVAAGELLFLDGHDGSCTVQIALRPSGTEPKIKFYFFVQAPPEVPAAESRQWTDRALSHAQTAWESWVRETLAAGGPAR